MSVPLILSVLFEFPDKSSERLFVGSWFKEGFCMSSLITGTEAATRFHSEDARRWAAERRLDSPGPKIGADKNDLNEAAVLAQTVLTLLNKNGLSSCKVTLSGYREGVRDKPVYSVMEFTLTDGKFYRALLGRRGINTMDEESISVPPAEEPEVPKGKSETEMGKYLLTLSPEHAAVMSNEELAGIVEQMKVLFVPRVHAAFNEAAKRLRNQ